MGAPLSNLITMTFRIDIMYGYDSELILVSFVSSRTNLMVHT